MTLTLPAAVLATVLASGVLPFGGGAYRKTEEGNRLYVDELYQDALRAYTEAQVDAPEAPELYYDIGNVLYRQGDHESAAEAYTRALHSAADALVGPAAFNLGNARYQQEDFEGAVKAYERALRADGADSDAKRNLELALRALQQQQQQQQQQQDGNDEEKEPEEGQDEAQPNEGEQEQQQDGNDAQQEQQPDDPNDAGEQEQQGDEGQQQQPPTQPGQMTPEQAERLLDGLEEQELENLRRQALQKVETPTKTSERDW